MFTNSKVNEPQKFYYKQNKGNVVNTEDQSPVSTKGRLIRHPVRDFSNNNNSYFRNFDSLTYKYSHMPHKPMASNEVVFTSRF